MFSTLKARVSAAPSLKYQTISHFSPIYFTVLIFYFAVSSRGGAATAHSAENITPPCRADTYR